MDGYIRFSLATKREEVSKALANIKDAVSQLWL
jgi:bifunctional pyridoxal-dependent enzyme with beta-cystathionase and maltose regulon repressor activities